jgi:hypothetical protein
MVGLESIPILFPARVMHCVWLFKLAEANMVVVERKKRVVAMNKPPVEALTDPESEVVHVFSGHRANISAGRSR